MLRGYGFLITLLGALWGSSYLFIKVGVGELPPSVFTAARTLIAGLLLTAILAARVGPREAAVQLRRAWAPVLVLALLSNAFPYWLIAWGEQHVDSGTAAIASASVPIFTALLALRFQRSQRVSGFRLVGLVVGFAGVGVLVGASPTGWYAIAGSLVVVVASVFYAAGALYGGTQVGVVSGPVLAAGSVLVAGILLLPFAAAQVPARFPSWKVVGALAGLILLGTVAAQLLLYTVLRLHGASRMTLVTYLIPAFAVVYGALALSEKVRWPELGGLALILLGVAIASGKLAPALRRREPAE